MPNCEGCFGAANDDCDHCPLMSGEEKKKEERKEERKEEKENNDKT